MLYSFHVIICKVNLSSNPFVLSDIYIFSLDVNVHCSVSYCIFGTFFVLLFTSLYLVVFKVATKHLKGGKESKIDVLVMENLLYRRNIVRLYDLKGSSRSRYNSDSSGSNKVLLDQNLLETMPTSPIFVGTKAKQLLERAVWNDTLFLAVS